MRQTYDYWLTCVLLAGVKCGSYVLLCRHSPSAAMPALGLVAAFKCTQDNKAHFSLVQMISCMHSFTTQTCSATGPVDTHVPLYFSLETESAIFMFVSRPHSEGRFNSQMV